MFALIAFAMGVPGGFLIVAFPYLARQGGLSLGQIGTIVGIAASANFLRLLWMPVCDMVSTLRRWAMGGIVFSALAVMALALVPMRPDYIPAITAIAFISQAAGSLPGIAGAGLMALTLDDAEKGQAAGAWQGGNLFAAGIGGAASLWCATHFGIVAGGLVAAMLTLVGLAALPFIADPVIHHSSAGLAARIGGIASDLMGALRDPRYALFMLAAATPIGFGAASNLFSGIASEWGASPDRISLVVGLGSALASALGAFAYAVVAGRANRFAVYLLTGIVLAFVGIAMAELPRSGSVFIAGVLAYAILIGAGYAAYTAVLLQLVGSGAAATKYTGINAFGNLPGVYMPVLLGMLHDGWSTRVMLWGEALVSLAAIALIWGLARMIGWERRTREALMTR